VDSQPRPQHYIFAHRVLPSLFFQNPERFLEILKEDGIAFLRFYWDKVGSTLDSADTEPLHGINYETRMLEDGTAVTLIELPPPQHMTEAYFTALVYRPLGAGGDSLQRYFTLEYGMRILEPGERSVLCEWTADNRHVNYGEGPEPTSRAFFTAVCDKLLPVSRT
jgi:hypothetical protein